MPDDPTFSELIERAREGDAEAREQLFAQLTEREDDSQILAMARRALPRGDLARDLIESRDLVQSALRSGWLELSRFRGSTEAELMGWLRTILRHKLSHAVRRKRPRLGKDADAEASREEETAEEPPIDVAIRDETQRRIQAAIEALPDDYRIVMERRLAGQSAPRIAEELGLSPAAVRKRESRAMARLRGEFGNPT